MTNQQTVQKITSHDTANAFYFWLKDNTQVENIQGYALERFSSGKVHSIGGYGFDMDWMWSNRAMLNDWINEYNKGRWN